MRVTHNSMALSVLANLQNNINRLGQTQQQLSSGKLIQRPSDSPAGTVSAMEIRSQIAANKQYARNADDGLGWLTVADNSLQVSADTVLRARDLVLQGMSAVSQGSMDNRSAIAAEIDQLKNTLMGLANSTYLDRPVFAGTANSTTAFDGAAATYGTYQGDDGQVQRTVGADMKVRVDVPGRVAFSTGIPSDDVTVFEVLTTISDKLRGTNAGPLGDELTRLEGVRRQMHTQLSAVGARQAQLDRMRQSSDDTILRLNSQLADVESIDLPKTITELQLQQTAYQAALSAGARVVQPSLIDFLR
jgi:flagellar hook-associated protein 3 FlgL